MSHLPPLVAAQDLERAGCRDPPDVARYTASSPLRRGRRTLGTTLTPTRGGSRGVRRRNTRVTDADGDGAGRAMNGAPDRNRTCDLWYRKPTLYPLSYGGIPVETTTARWVPRTSKIAPGAWAPGRSSVRDSVSVSGSLRSLTSPFSFRGGEDTPRRRLVKRYPRELHRQREGEGCAIRPRQSPPTSLRPTTHPTRPRMSSIRRSENDSSPVIIA